MNMTKGKKVIAGLLILLAGYAVWTQTYKFDAEKATNHLTEHGLDHSKHWCAWYTMRALQAGGCPAIILPAQWYRYYMPLVQFEEIPEKGYIPKKGDVVVFERPAGRDWKKISEWWGHVAMYNGEQWISDYKQGDKSPYRKKVPYRLYRYKK